MDLENIRQTLEAGLDDCQLELQAEGNKLLLIAVSSSFAGLSRVKRQQLVYAMLNEKIASGEIHAVTMQTKTSDE